MKKYVKYLLVMAMAFLFLGGMKAEAQSLKITAPAKTIYVRQKVRMKVAPLSMKGRVKWRSSDRKVASVSKSGTVTAKKPGMVKIYAVSLENRNVKATYQLSVKVFQNRTLSADCYSVRSYSGLLPSVGEKYKVFCSKKEVDEYLQADKQNGGRIYYGVEKKLKEYKKSFFKNKSLCIAYISTEGSGDTNVSVESMRLVQDKRGKIIWKLRAEIVAPGIGNCAVASYYAVAELDKRDAAMIEGCKTEKLRMDENPPIID